MAVFHPFLPLARMSAFDPLRTFEADRFSGFPHQSLMPLNLLACHHQWLLLEEAASDWVE